MIKIKPSGFKEIIIYSQLSPCILTLPTLPPTPWVYAFIIFCGLKISSMAALRNTSSGQISLLSGNQREQRKNFFLRDAATSQSGVVMNLLIGATDVFPEPVPRYSSH